MTVAQRQTHKLWAEEYADSALARRQALEDEEREEKREQLEKDVKLDLRFAQVYATLATVK